MERGGGFQKFPGKKETTSVKGSWNGKRKPRDNTFFLQNTVKENGFEKGPHPQKKEGKKLV